MILDKAKMAHDYAIEMLKRGDPERSIAFDAWTLADAMQAEADKRNYSEKQDSSEWQPDWSQAPDWANWWAMDENKNTRWIYSELEQPYISDIFLRWCAVGRFDSEDAPSFGYTGDWRNSLRKRPE